MWVYSLSQTSWTLTKVPPCRYMWRHGYNTSFYQLAEQIASPVTKSTVLSTIINRNDSTFPTDADYFQIIRTCATLSDTSCVSFHIIVPTEDVHADACKIYDEQQSQSRCCDILMVSLLRACH